MALEVLGRRTMETIKDIGKGIVYGFWDSLVGIKFIWNIDAELSKLDVETQRRARERERRIRRSPSPTPSSAAAMAREELKDLLQQNKENPDERSLATMQKRAKEAELSGIKQEKKIAKKVLKCCGLNGGFTWLSIIVFEKLLIPILSWGLSHCGLSRFKDSNLVISNLSVFFHVLWVLPIFLIGKMVSSVWFSEIATAAYRVRKGEPSTIPTFRKYIADNIFNVLVQCFFLAQSMLMNFLPSPFMGKVLCNLHLTMLYSLYAFEYKWGNTGWELHRRLSYIENNWPYFLGFGIPLTIVGNLTNTFIVDSCIFSMFFPLFILSGTDARPTVDSMVFPLRIFTPVVTAANCLTRLCFGGPPKVSAAKLAQQNKQLILQQEKKLQQQMALQQRIENEYLGRSHSRLTQNAEEQSRPTLSRQSSRFSHSPSPTAGPFRYQQPPTQLRVPLITRAAHAFPEHGHFMSGTPSTASGGASSANSSAQTVRRR